VAHPRLIRYTLLVLLVALVVFVLLLPLLDEVGLAPSEPVHTMSGDAGQLLVANMGPHPLYTGKLFPFGKITLRFDDDNRFLVLLRMDGLEESCVQCHFAIVEGTSCADPTLVSDTHLYRPVPGHDPTKSPFDVAYYSATNGIASSTATIFNGLPAEENKGHAINVYDSANNPLACGLLEAQSATTVVQKLYANLVPLPGHPPNPATNTTLQGSVLLQFFADHSFLFSFEVEGLSSKCFACPIRIHEGQDCSQGVGHVYWNLDIIPGDPYSVTNGVFYHSTDAGYTSHAFFLFTGYTFEQNKKRTVVIYDQSNNPVGCGELSTFRHKHFPDMSHALPTAGTAISEG